MRHLACLLLLLVTACAGGADEDIEALELTDQARAALSRLRFSPVRVGDRVERGDVLLCGAGDRLTVAFPRRLVVEYLGIDAEQLLPELFAGQAENELFLEISGPELVRIELPQGIGATVPHPPGRVRDLRGTPSWSGDLRAIESLFEAGEMRELFAERTAQPSEAEPWKRQRVIGIVPFPRMGPKSGVVIDRVLAGSPADRAGLTTGDKIIGVGGTPTGDAGELKRALAAAPSGMVLVRVRKAGASEPMDVPLELP